MVSRRTPPPPPFLAAVHPAVEAEEEGIKQHQILRDISCRAAELPALTVLSNLCGRKEQAEKRNISLRGSIKYHFIIVNGCV